MRVGGSKIRLDVLILGLLLLLFLWEGECLEFGREEELGSAREVVGCEGCCVRIRG